MLLVTLSLVHNTKDVCKESYNYTVAIYHTCLVYYNGAVNRNELKLGIRMPSEEPLPIVRNVVPAFFTVNRFVYWSPFLHPRGNACRPRGGLHWCT